MLELNEEIKQVDNLTLEMNKKESTQLNLKFISYRQAAESNERKLKEANNVIDQLKEEKATFEEIEKNLRSQILSFHNRLIQMHGALRNMVAIQEKQRENNKKIVKIQATIEGLNELIKDVRERSNVILEKTEKERDLVAIINELKNKLMAKELDCDLIKTEKQSLEKEKKDLEGQVLRTETLEREIQILKEEIVKLKTHWEAKLLIHKKQIEYNEQIIRDYEKERKTLLEEFELPKDKIIIENNIDGFTWADSTVNINWEESAISDMQTINSKDTREGETKPQPTSSQLVKENDASLPSLSTPSNSKCYDIEKSVENFDENEKSQNRIFESSTLQKETSGCRIPPKRKLYSTNCNHYFI